MKKTVKWTACLLGVVALCYFSYLGAVLFAAPSTPPPDYERFMALENQLDAIVDRHWSRADAVPTGDEISAYRELIDELNHFDYAPLEQQHKWAVVQLPSAQDRMLDSLRPFLYDYEVLSPYIGESLAETAAYAFAGPSMYAHHYYYEQVQLSRLLTARMLGLRSDARYHLAMALILANDNDAAVDQLTKMLRENPDNVHTYATYSIGARAHAEKNLDYVAAVTAAGGRTDWWFEIPADALRMRPWHGSKLCDFR